MGRKLAKKKKTKKKQKHFLCLIVDANMEEKKFRQHKINLVMGGLKS